MRPTVCLSVCLCGLAVCITTDTTQSVLSLSLLISFVSSVRAVIDKRAVHLITRAKHVLSVSRITVTTPPRPLTIICYQNVTKQVLSFVHASQLFAITKFNECSTSTNTQCSVHTSVAILFTCTVIARVPATVANISHRALNG